MQPKLFLIHGLFFRGSWLGYMRHQLAAMGYTVHSFSYPSTKRNTQTNAEKLVRYVAEHSTDADTCHFVGHSLGGLLIRYAYAINPSMFTGRVVTLGTSHTGSAIANKVMHTLHPRILGQSFPQGLDGDVPAWNGKVELGSLAGNRNVGVNNLLHALQAPHDGTVAVSETLLPNMKDHITLPVAHTEMVYSKAVRQQIDCFLKNGSFRHG